MSDFYRNQDNPFQPTDRQGDDANDHWVMDESSLPQDGYEPFGGAYGTQQADPLAAYDDPRAMPPQGGERYADWQPSTPGGASFLTDDPAPFGIEMQQGGLPLFSQDTPMEVSFGAQGADAPTRIDRPPVCAQMVSKRTTVERGSKASRPAEPVAAIKTEPEQKPSSSPYARPQGAAPAAASPFARPAAPAVSQEAPEAPARRRRSRVERHADEGELQAAHAPSMDVPTADAPSFDPFRAGDSESPEKAADELADLQRRAATPGGRYTGARTAMPASGSVADRGRAMRERPMSEQDESGQPLDQAVAPANNQQHLAVRSMAAQRPPQAGQRPPQAGQAGRPVQPGQRPPQAGQTGRPVQPGQRPPQAGQAGRPVQPGQRPAQAGQAGRPVQPGQRPAQAGRPMQGKRPMTMSATPDGQGMPIDGFEQPMRKQMPMGIPAQRGKRPHGGEDDLNPHASVARKRYDFEDENDEELVRRHGALVPVVVVLLVIGALLAGLCLPDWQGMGGGFGTAMGSLKSSVVSVFNNVKNMIVPQEEPLKSFSASASEGTAPTQVIFNVQTSKNVAGIRIINEQGVTVYSQAYAPDLELTGVVINNSNVLLWKPTYAVEDAYSGGFTVYAVKKDGTESEGVRSDTTLAIAAPKPAAPAMQGFVSDTTVAHIPTKLGFTLLTSDEVSAVRIADSYNQPVVTFYDTDEGGDDLSMIDNGDGTRTWTLSANVDAAYAGSYVAQYQLAGGDLNFTPSDMSVNVELTANAAAPTSAPDSNDSVGSPDAQGDVNDAMVLNGEEPIGGIPEGDGTDIADPADNPGGEPADGAADIPEATPAPEATPEAAPASTPLPAMSAAATDSTSPSALKLVATLYSGGKTVKSYTRTKTIAMLNPFTTSAGGTGDYAVWPQAGVLTYRGGPLRQNASYGTVEVENKTLTTIWSQPVGSMRISKGTLYGVGDPGQAVIVKWATEIRQRMKLNQGMADVKALKEVIVAGQDGKLYFYNLLDGTATREAFDLGAPSAGGLSIATNGTPVLGVGQSRSILEKKTVKSGYHIINLLNNKALKLIQSDGKEQNSNYTSVLGAALFDGKSGAMVFGGQNGVLYSVELGTREEAYDYQTGKLSIGTDTQAYKTQAGKQSKKNTNINGSVAMYNNYVYYGDQGGIVQCVDINTLTPIWAVNTGDNINATPALDAESADAIALYTGNTILSQGKNGVCTIRRLNALTGAEDWQYVVPETTYNTKYEIGCESSPVVGQKSVSNMVIFTVNKGATAVVIALDKKSGSVLWQTPLTCGTLSSPVAVYNKNGDAWILQAQEDGSIHLMDAKTGAILNTLKLDGEIVASPAVYGNLMIIGTTGKGKGSVTCVKID